MPPLFSITLSCSLLLSSLCHGEIMEWAHALGSDSSQDARFTAVEAPVVGNVPTNATYACGQFRNTIRLPGMATPYLSQGGFDGLVVRFDQASATSDATVTWASQAYSNSTVQVTDLALLDDTNTIYICGVYADAVTFGPNSNINLPAPAGGTKDGFVAKLHPVTGQWIAAYPLGSLQPLSIALDPTGSFFLSSVQKAASKFDNSGNLLWEQDGPSNGVSYSQIAVIKKGGNLSRPYVLGTVNNGTHGSDVILLSLTAGGTIDWGKTVTSPATESAGGLGVSAQGLISFSIQSADPTVNYEGLPLAPPANYPVTQSYLIRTRGDGFPLWTTRLAEPNNSIASMQAPDLAHDPQGNVHLAVNYSGSFLFDGQTRSGSADTGILTVGDDGTPYLFQQSSGTAETTGLAIAAPLRERQFLVGAYKSGSQATFGSVQLTSTSNARAFAAYTRKLAGQSCYLIRQTDNDNTAPAVFLANLRSVLSAEQGNTPQLNRRAAIYREFNSPDLLDVPGSPLLGVVGYAAFVTFQDIDILEGSGLYLVEEDPELKFSGQLSPAPANLARLNDLSASAPFTFTYPEMCQPIRLYFIDTAVMDPGGSYFANNSNLTLLDPLPGGYGELVRATGETAGIVTAEHGTNLMSLVAGRSHGVAPATPITAKIYDIFPSGDSARATALYDGLLRAREDRLAPENSYQPSLFLIASNTITTVDSGDLPALDIILSACEADGIPIVMSAGNEGGPASTSAPSLFGAKSNILCVGASKTDGTFYHSVSNRGPEVKAIAPGEQVVVASEFAGSLVDASFDGTSASAALTAGCLIQFQAANPWLAGSDLVSTFLAHSVHSPSVSYEGLNYPPIKAATVHPDCYTDFQDWVNWFILAGTTPTGNDDGDGFTNLEEYVFGFNPRSRDSLSQGFGIESYLSPTLTMGFPVAGWLWNAAETGPNYTLRDGSTSLAITASNDLTAFTPESVALSGGSDCDGQILLTFPINTSSPSHKFFRVETDAP